MDFEIDAVLFDNDGVLVDSHALTEPAWRTLADEFDLDFDTLAAVFVGRRAEDTLAEHLPTDRCATAVARLEDLETALAAETPPLPGALELLAALPSGSWAIVTSASNRLARARWHGAGLGDPQNVVTADDVTIGKPDPEPFLLGAAKLGVDPARCVVFEDSPSGGLAARAAGASVVAVGRQEWTDAPDARIDDLRSVAVASTQPLRLRIRN